VKKILRNNIQSKMKTFPKFKIGLWTLFILGVFALIVLALLPFSKRRMFPALPPNVAPIPRERQVYEIISKEKPTFTQVIIDPFDPRKGERQTVLVRVRDDAPIRSVNATLKTDKGAFSYPLRFVAKNRRDGIWRGAWRTIDTHFYVYRLQLTAQSDTGASSIELTFR
jgi:hypothetical protein